MRSPVDDLVGIDYSLLKDPVVSNGNMDLEFRVSCLTWLLVTSDRQPASFSLGPSRALQTDSLSLLCSSAVSSCCCCCLGFSPLDLEGKPHLSSSFLCLCSSSCPAVPHKSPYLRDLLMPCPSPASPNPVNRAPTVFFGIFEGD